MNTPTAETTDYRNEVDLALFYEEETKNSTEQVIVRVKNSKDLKWLAKKHLNENADMSKPTPIRKVINLRFKEIFDEVMLTTDDIVYLATLWNDYFHYSHKPEANKILARMRTLYQVQFTDLEKLVAHYGKLPSIHSDYQTPVYRPAEECIIGLLSVSEKRYDAIFLLNLWLVVRVESEVEKAIEGFMPDALKNEGIISELVSLKEKASSNGYYGFDCEMVRMIYRRTNVRIEELLPIAREEEFETYYRASNQNSTIVSKIDEHLAKFVEVKIKAMTIDEIIEYRRKFYFLLIQGHGFSRTSDTFCLSIQVKLPKFLVGMVSASKLYPYFEELDVDISNEHRDDHVMILKFNELLPKYLSTNPKLSEAIEWYRDYDMGKRYGSTLKGIILELIKKENDPSMLMLIHKSEKDLFIPAQKRFVKLVLKMKKPNPWFLDCIKHEKFFGSKKLFIEKAKEFSEK